MKKTLIAIFIATFTLSYFFEIKNPHGFITQYTAALVNTSGAPSGKTGAPGESNCTMCHAGSVNDGSLTSNITYDGTNNEYIPGNTYSMNFSITNGSQKNGFQLVILDSLQNNDVGTLTATDLLNTQINANNRTYLNHTSAGTTLNTWGFEWTAPSNDVGPIIIYYSYNVTNNASNTAGDNIYLGQMTLYPANTLSNCIKEDFTFDCYSTNNDKIVITTNQIIKNPVLIEIYDLQGKEVFSEKMQLNSKANQLNISNEYLNGIYIITIKGSKIYQSKKLFI
jgi:hypothetical protein